VQNVKCHPQANALNPCEDVMGSNWLRSSVWIVVSLAVVGNTAVLVVLFSNRSELTVPKFLMCNLAFADFCMGSYLLLIASIDLHSMGEYFNFAFDWQYGELTSVCLTINGLIRLQHDRMGLQNSRLPHRLCRTFVDIHSHHHHGRAMVRHNTRHLPKQATEAQSGHLHHDLRLDLLDSDGDVSFVRYQQLFIDEVCINKLAIRSLIRLRFHRNVINLSELRRKFMNYSAAS